MNECPCCQRLGPPPWYPYRSQKEADEARDRFVDSLVQKFKEKEKLNGRLQDRS